MIVPLNLYQRCGAEGALPSRNITGGFELFLDKSCLGQQCPVTKFLEEVITMEPCFVARWGWRLLVTVINQAFLIIKHKISHTVLPSGHVTFPSTSGMIFCKIINCRALLLEFRMSFRCRSDCSCRVCW